MNVVHTHVCLIQFLVGMRCVILHRETKNDDDDDDWYDVFLLKPNGRKYTTLTLIEAFFAVLFVYGKLRFNFRFIVVAINGGIERNIL